MTRTDESVDGRTARRDRNRDLVLDAVLDLFAEGHLTPSAPQVAERSGVSLRSVFRYYDDRDALMQAAIARQAQRTAPLWDIPRLGDGDLDDRIDRFVAARLRLYRAIAPVARAALVRAVTTPAVADQFARARELNRHQLEAMFAPELRAMPGAVRRDTLSALDALFQFEATEHLCHRLAMSDAQAARVLRAALRALLTSAAHQPTTGY